MSRTIKVLLAITLILSGVLYFSNNYINGIEKRVIDIEGDTFVKEAQIKKLTEKYQEEVNEEILDDTPSSKELVHIMPRDFVWNEVVYELDQIEMKVGIEAYKSVTKSELSNFNIYKDLKEYIKITTVNLNFSVENNDYSKIGSFIKEIQNLNKLVIIDEISYSYPGNPYFVNMKLLYFTYET